MARDLRPFALFSTFLILLAAAAGFSEEKFNKKIEIEQINYRPVSYETEKVTEYKNEIPNEGGLLLVYFKNISDERVEFRNWHVNRKSGSHWRLSKKVSWDRFLNKSVNPGKMGVLEINAVSEHFAEGEEIEFALTDRSYRPVGYMKTKKLIKEPVRITYMRFMPNRRTVQLHLKNDSDNKVAIKNIEIDGRETKKVNTVSEKINPGRRGFAEISIKGRFREGKYVIVKIDYEKGGEEKKVYAHRKYFVDKFPVGTWGLDDDRLKEGKGYGFDACVRGGSAHSDFYKSLYKKYGINTLYHSGTVPKVEMIQQLKDHPAVLCWQITDEPDWKHTAQRMLMSVEITEKYGPKKPTFITYCRNVKFFEYAYLVDIPCHDHYCVTAPSTSKWPYEYGTHLEETAYYTRDLKIASEPKGIWVWTQGLFDWDQRPKRPVPTVSEAKVQLFYNLSRGAKGILWFTFRKGVGNEYPDLKECIGKWNNIIQVIKDDLLGCEPAVYEHDNEDIDIAGLLGKDKAFVFVTNKDYRIDDKAYQWNEKENVKISIPLPEWLNPKAAIELNPGKFENVEYELNEGSLRFEINKLKDCRLFAFFENPGAKKDYLQKLK